MSAALASLCAYDIDASIESVFCVLRRANHVHDDDSGVVKTLNHMWWRDSDSADEQLCALLDRDGDQLVQLAVGVVVVGLARAVADLGESKVDAEGEVLGGEVFLELVDDLAELSRGVAQAANAANAASVGDSGCKGSTGCARHTGEQDGVLDTQQGGEWGGDWSHGYEVLRGRVVDWMAC